MAERKTERPGWFVERAQRMRDMESEIELLERENEFLRREQKSQRLQGSENKSLRRIFLESLAGGGLLIAVIGGGYQVASDSFDGQSERCAQAHEAIMDDTLNTDLSPQQRKAYIDRQFEIARQCDRETK